MKPKHTKGPWTVGELVVAPLGYRCIPILNEAGESIADCEYQSDHEGAADKARHRATLIASAPELVAALEGLVAEMVNPVHVHHRDKYAEYQISPESITAARAALEKAGRGVEGGRE